ncbi:class I SAM-dependent DNA methyltransferase, partial [Bacteroidota bacterium]
MKDNDFIKELEFDLKPLSGDYKFLSDDDGVDFEHCSGDYPAVFFKEVGSYNAEQLRSIADIQRRIWNYSNVVFLYVVSTQEIRIYNCNETPFNHINIDDDDIIKEMSKREIISCKKTDKEKLNDLAKVFSSIAIDSGLIWYNPEYSKKIKIQTKVDKYLVKSLLSLAKILKQDIKNEDIIHSLLLRSIFLMYLQDKGAIPIEIWEELDVSSFLEALDNLNVTYRLFDIIDKHFNGNVFPVSNQERKYVNDKHLHIIKQCLINGSVDNGQEDMFSDWRLFDFSIIRIELLSEIYENFLNEFDPIRKKETGTYYTPPALVELVLDNVLPVKEEINFHLKILDPAMGSGIFLVQSYKRIVERWKRATNKHIPKFSELKRLMLDSIFGVENDENAIKIAAFSLYLALLDNLEPPDVWLKNGEQFPYLINDPKIKEYEKQGQ